MGRLFDLDNPFFRFMGKLFDMVVLNIIALIACIPIITIGPSLTAVYYVALKTVRDEEGYVIQSFVKSFKQNFKQGVVLELIIAAAAAILTLDLTVTYQWMQQADAGVWVRLLFYALVGFTMLAIVSLVYIFPILAKFDNPIKRVLSLSVMMSMKHLPLSILMVVITGAAGLMVYLFLPAILVAVGLAAFFNAMVLRKIFDNYITIDSEGKVVEGENGAAEESEDAEEAEKAEDSEDLKDSEEAKASEEKVAGDSEEKEE